jgi:hypothetical protein
MRSYMKERRRKEKDKIQQAQERFVPMSLRLKASTAHRIQALTVEAVATGQYPWRTTQETLRDLIDRGLLSLVGTSDSIDEYLPLLRREREMSEIERAEASARSILGRTVTMIRKLLDVDGENEAIQYYAATRGDVFGMPDTVWRRWLLRELKDAFPKIHLRAKRGEYKGPSLEPEDSTKEDDE